jgi:hypothetical protein
MKLSRGDESEKLSSSKSHAAKKTVKLIIKKILVR